MSLDLDKALQHYSCKSLLPSDEDVYIVDMPRKKYMVYETI